LCHYCGMRVMPKPLQKEKTRQVEDDFLNGLLTRFVDTIVRDKINYGKRPIILFAPNRMSDCLLRNNIGDPGARAKVSKD